MIHSEEILPTPWCRQMKPYEVSDSAKIPLGRKKQYLKLDWNESLIPPSPLVKERYDDAGVGPCIGRSEVWIPKVEAAAGQDREGVRACGMVEVEVVERLVVGGVEFADRPEVPVAYVCIEVWVLTHR